MGSGRRIGCFGHFCGLPWKCPLPPGQKGPDNPSTTNPGQHVGKGGKGVTGFGCPRRGAVPHSPIETRACRRAVSHSPMKGWRMQPCTPKPKECGASSVCSPAKPRSVMPLHRIWIFFQCRLFVTRLVALEVYTSSTLGFDSIWIPQPGVQ